MHANLKSVNPRKLTLILEVKNEVREKSDKLWKIVQWGCNFCLSAE